jgi:SagB-type dehydrogenase family enzyme
MSHDPIQAALAYHELSKHRLPNRYARSLGYLDWDHQPNPFRLYSRGPGPDPGSDQPVERVALIREGFAIGPSLAQLYEPSQVAAAPVDPSSIARLLFDSLGLSAWKQAGGQRWALRCNPSSGNLHPTEAYPITGPSSGFGAGVWHYTPLVHALERRAALDPATWAEWIGDGEGLLVGLSSIAWREAWKYGERAYRYCQHDVGHALAALAYAAASLGWHTRMLGGFDDAAITRALGLDTDGPEAEHPDLLVFVGPRVPSGPVTPARVPALTFEGVGNRLSEAHHPWEVIAQVAHHCARVGPVEPVATVAGEGPLTGREPSGPELPARPLFRSRRSAVAMDGVTSLSRAAWLAMLARTFPRPGQVPFASLLGPARVHLLLFVHRVEGVEPGLYLLIRDPARREPIAAAIRPGFEWSVVDSGELELPLYRLELADTRQAAKLIACRQDIAADGAFAVALLAELEPTLRERGAWMYRHLHWEAGAIGQVLYLEAEAAGVRGTGIGCFFDDAVAELLGLRDRALACVYGFTIGGPVDDPRLRTLDAYAHLEAV